MTDKPFSGARDLRASERILAGLLLSLAGSASSLAGSASFVVVVEDQDKVVPCR